MRTSTGGAGAATGRRARAGAGGAAAVALLLVTLLVATMGAPSGAAAPDGGPAREGTPARAARVDVVTLITGDRVRVVSRPGDGPDAVDVVAAPRPHGGPVGFHRIVDDDALYVVPTDVLPLVPDRLDRDLFDVRRLVADGRTGTLPVIVQSAAGVNGRAAAPDWEDLGVRAERSLESFGAVAGEADTRATADAPAPSWELLAALGAGDAPSARSRGPVRKVWLDRRVAPLDARSMPQIGAPQAWESGHTGEGVTVGVVDTGVDVTHPDLDDGVVVARRDFTGSGAGDEVGHGTHVASIVAGSGEASDGANRGVAPDADLISAKVLTPDGGDLSWVIDGMEWAAAQGADVLNLSLGEPGNYTDGTDPGSLAVDALSERYGLLAVAAAGNEGPEPGTIPTLGTATSALTVAAVGPDDAVAGFSSVGPRVDGAFKPEIAAPGVGIVAARAAGTTLGEPVGEWYVRASGTSMAAPHVAGAAAVVASARPDLTGQELKHALMASARPGGNSVWQEGAGRVWIPGALSHRLTTEPVAVSFGQFRYPQDDAEPVTETVTYRNPTADDVRLDLALAVTDGAGAPVPDGAAVLSAPQVTVPAGGEASVDVTVDPSAVAAGDGYGGAITATAGDGRTVRTAVGWVNERERYALTIRATDADGSPATGDDHVVLQNAVDPWDDLWLEPRFTDGVATVRVDPGAYYLAGFLEARDPGSSWPHTVTAVADPRIEVREDTTVELDARDARPLDVTTHREAHDAGKDLTFYRLVDGAYNITVGARYAGYTDDVVAPDFRVLPTEQVGEGVEFELVSQTQQRQPVLDVGTLGPDGADVPATTVDGSVPVEGRDVARLVDAGPGVTGVERAGRRGGLRGAFVLVDDGDVQALAAAAEKAGAAGVLVRGAGLGPVEDTVRDVRIPVLATDRDTADMLRERLGEGPVVLSLVGRAQAGYTYDTVVERTGRVPDEDLTLHAGPDNLATLRMDYRAMSEAGDVRATPIVVRDGRQGIFGLASALTAPWERTEYVTADPGTRWYHQVMPRPDDPFLASAFESGIRAYSPGDEASDVWLAQAHHGGFTMPGTGEYGTSSAVRDWDMFTFELPLWADDAGHSMPVALPSVEQADVRMRLWQDGRKILDRPDTFGWVFGLPDEPARYRLRAEVARSTPWWQLSTRVATDWEFTSRFADDRVVLPLLQVDYGLSLDDHNRGGLVERLRLSATQQAGAETSPVRAMRLWASADDGGTWAPVDVRRRDDGTFDATVRVPRGTEHVSLRVRAEDTAGSSVTETVTRAYAVE